MTTATVTTIPAPRHPEVEELEDETVRCCFDAEPVTDMAEHALACGECFAYHVQEN